MRISTVIILLVAMMSASAAGKLPNLSTTRGVLFIPVLTLDGQTINYQMEIALDFETGQFKIVRSTSSPNEPLEITYGQPFWLVAGQSAVVKDTNFKLMFNGVLFSHCPSKAQCVIGDLETAVLKFFQGNKKYPVTFPLSTPNSKTINKVVNITLLEIDPSPKSGIFPSAYAAKLVITPYNEIPPGSCGDVPVGQLIAQLIEPYDLFESINDMLAVEYLESGEWPSDNDLSKVITPPTGTYTKGFIMNAAELYIEATMGSESNGVLSCLADKSIRFYYYPESTWTCSVNIPNGVPSEYMKDNFPMTCD